MKKILNIFIKTPELIAVGIFMIVACLFLINYMNHKSDTEAIEENEIMDANGNLENNQEQSMTDLDKAENPSDTGSLETENLLVTEDLQNQSSEKANDKETQPGEKGLDSKTEETTQEDLSGPRITIETNEDNTTTILCETKQTEQGTYTIYQLSMTDEAGGCSYAIQMPNGKFIMIDSGYKLDGQWIQDFLQSHGGEVDSWYITHPHFDHVGGLIQILQNDSSQIYIDKIYYAPFTAEFYTEERPEKDLEMIGNASLFSEFEALKSRDNIKFIPVERGDVITTEGVSITCMSSFDEDLFDVNGNSLALHMNIKGVTMLLTADITETTIDAMKEYWGVDHSLWQVDFLQMPHHGYSAGIATDSLYQITMPTAAFIDCSTKEYEENAADLQHHLGWLEALEIPVIKRFEGTNEIVIDSKEREGIW